MIARAWHGRVPLSKSDAYAEFLDKKGIRDYLATHGNAGVYVMRRIENDVAHFLLISLWDSMESIRQFAGQDVDKAYYYPEDENFLLEFESNVQHYHVLNFERPVEIHG
ncbi:antibiotic biosynthesis monooxygenase [bacterium]|nr:antibiotic biosynthesis monooxygenase [bacterium]